MKIEIYPLEIKVLTKKKKQNNLNAQFKKKKTINNQNLSAKPIDNRIFLYLLYFYRMATRSKSTKSKIVIKGMMLLLPLPMTGKLNLMMIVM